jgi:large subunit ribosomal protein LP2
MKYLAAYCLATLGGNSNPTADDVEKILSSVGVNVDKDQL